MVESEVTNQLECVPFESTYLEIVLSERKPKTNVYQILNKSNNSIILGEVKWYANWRQYCFFPMEETIFSRGCMQDINLFIYQLMQQRTIQSNRNE